jgi:tetratricopeptide (TPR) repeat protein
MTDANNSYTKADLNDINERVTEARALRRDDQLEESQALLFDLLEEYPRHPLVLFEVGGSYDVMGDEERAVPYYRDALTAGLSGDDRQECLVCLGSSLRVIGESEEAVSVLQEAVDDYPERPSARVFLALAMLDEGAESEAVALLLDVILETTEDEDIKAYAGAIEYYRDELRGDLDE